MMEWISVKDRLPDVHQATNGDYSVSDFVLIYFEGEKATNKICVATYEVEKWGSCIWTSFTDTVAADMDYSVTHWMPLPNPPKE